MNLIPKICELLGVEIGEEFGIISFEGVYKFVDYGLLKKRDNECGWETTGDLRGLITGEYEVKKLPFEPKNGERYWTVYWKEIGDMPCAVYETWRGDSCDFANKVSGNCFRTQAEAEKHKYEIYEKLTGKKWEVAE